MSNEKAAVKQVKEEIKTKDQEIKNNFFNQTEQKISSLKEKVNGQVNNLQDKTQVVKEKVSDNLSGAADRVHQTADQTRELLDKKTDKINELAHRTIEKANELGHRAGDVLESSSEYVRNFDIEETRQQFKKKIQKNPGVSLAVAGIFGLLIGLLIGRPNR